MGLWIPELLWKTALWTGLASLLSYGLYSGYVVRSRVKRLRKAGLPMPEWSWFAGHLLLLQRYIKLYPANTFINMIATRIAHDLGNKDMFYLDLWPFLEPTLVVCSPEAATHVSTRLNLPKPLMYRKSFDPIIGGPNMLTMNGAEWKYWRALFNPGFALGYLQEQIPSIVNSVEIFCGLLRAREGDVFRLEDVVTRLTMEIIMKVVLDLDLNYQRSPHPLADALRSMISWTSFGNPLNKYHPIRPFVLKYYGNIMDSLIREELNKRMIELVENKTDNEPKVRKQSRSVISLTLEGYLADQPSQPDKIPTLDENFAAYAAYQLRLFLFAGHDTTTSVLVYAYHMLHKHPDILTTVQEEQTSVFGLDVTTVAAQLRTNPFLINQTPYTLAVIKETMRLFPPAGSNRAGNANVELIDHEGTRFPTEGCLISLCHHAIHHNPRAWPRVNEFIPDRWLVDPSHELHPPNGGFRAFEHGPRNCVGQNVSLTELRVALAMTVRSVKIKPAYEEWDAMHPDGLRQSLLKQLGLVKPAMNSIDGERAYQIEKGGAHPANGYPCTVEVLRTL